MGFGNIEKHCIIRETEYYITIGFSICFNTHLVMYYNGYRVKLIIRILFLKGIVLSLSSILRIEIKFIL